ncbi:MAG TPA: M1 family metallopeptidase [Steroidobacteraceae bacterium]|nr:M1 family metallopeptidase [Steroidobacteraceae bacterium]
MKMILTAFALLIAAPAVIRAAQTEPPRGRLPQTVTPQHYGLMIDIDPRKPGFAGHANIDIVLHEPASTLWIDGLGLHIEAVTAEAAGKRLTGRYAEVDHDNGVSRIDFRSVLPAGAATLHFRYRAMLQTSPQGLYRTQAGKDWYVFSQMEAIDARRAFPGFDEPGFKTPFDITIVTHGGDLAVTNTPELRSTALGGGAVRHDFVTTKPLPTYLIAFAVGPLDVADAGPIPPNAVRGRPLPLRIIGTRGQANAFAFALKETPEIVRRLEEYMGIAFPYPKLDLIASPIHLGAMENAGAVIFADSLLALGDAPSPRQESGFGMVTAHELAHQWFGDLVTPAWWDDIWLNESFAEWMGSKVADQWRPGLGIQKEQLDSTLTAMNTDALHAGRPIHEPVTDNRQIGGTFDSITYEKGAGVIAMVESYLGAERFQKGVRLHLTRHADGSGTAADFFAAMAEASGEPAVIDAFRSFVDQPGLPFVAVSAGPDGALQLEQTRYRLLGPNPSADEEWLIPFCVRIYAAAQSDKRCTLLAGPKGLLSIPSGEQGSVIHPNADGAGYYRFAIDAAMLQALLTKVPAMNAREAIVLADSVGAAFEAGRLSFADFYGAAKVLAEYPDRTAALSLGYKLDDYATRLASTEDRTLIEQAIVGLYKHRLMALGLDTTPGRYAAEPAEQQLMRRQLLALVGLSGRDREIRRMLAPLAAASAADPAAIDPLLRARAWAIGLQVQGDSLIEPLKALLRETRDPALRQDASFALSHADSPAIANEVRALVLDPRVDLQSAIGILFTQVSNPRTRESAWTWYIANQPAVLARIPALFRAFIGQIGAEFCSPNERTSFDADLATKLRSENGGAIAVDRTLERIDDCIALREKTGQAIHTTLAAELGVR